MGYSKMEPSRMDIMQLKTNVHILARNEQGEITYQHHAHNLVVDTGLATIAERLAGVDTPANTKGTITYLGIGTGTTAAAAGDTTLDTEVFRKQISVRTYTDEVAKFRIYLNTTEANVAIKEIGLFGDDATVTADTGTLYARLIIDKTKTSSETLTIDWEVELAAV